MEISWNNIKEEKVATSLLVEEINICISGSNTSAWEYFLMFPQPEFRDEIQNLGNAAQKISLLPGGMPMQSEMGTAIED